MNKYYHYGIYTVKLLIWIKWDGKPSRYAENQDNWIFLLKIGYIGGLQFSCYYLRNVPAFKPFNHT